ncbi:MAG: hypothetical protein ABS81_24785 [Pseudonocardia sp. SCN 72-86]|nr:MAG: hypothetical protein ABS81_24785 [Pseudonocardia sp. SCN 72-86]
MSEPTRGLTDDDVDQVARLVESLDRSGFDFLQVELGDLRITIGTGSPPVRDVAAPPPVAEPVVAPVAAPVSAPVAVPQPVAPVPPPSTNVGGVEITAPTMGIFYARPEPGKPPFVAIGDVVEETTTVALVEVMKTFHSVAAGVRGTVVEIAVSDTDFVEFGAVLMRVDPA